MPFYNPNRPGQVPGDPDIHDKDPSSFELEIDEEIAAITLSVKQSRVAEEPHVDGVKILRKNSTRKQQATTEPENKPFSREAAYLTSPSRRSLHRATENSLPRYSEEIQSRAGRLIERVTGTHSIPPSDPTTNHGFTRETTERIPFKAMKRRINSLTPSRPLVDIFRIEVESAMDFSDQHEATIRRIVHDLSVKNQLVCNAELKFFLEALYATCSAIVENTNAESIGVFAEEKKKLRIRIQNLEKVLESLRPNEVILHNETVIELERLKLRLEQLENLSSNEYEEDLKESFKRTYRDLSTKSTQVKAYFDKFKRDSEISVIHTFATDKAENLLRFFRTLVKFIKDYTKLLELY